MTCPRCRSLMIPESDYWGEYRTCICCGYQSYPEPPNYTSEKNTGRKVPRLIGRARTTREERRHAPR